MRFPHPFPPATATLLALALVAPAAFAQAPKPAAGTPSAPLTEEPAAPGPRLAKPRRAANPLYPQIAALLEAEKAQIAGLRARLAGARDSDAAVAIQREIEQTRTVTEIGILRLQAEHAGKQGRGALAEQIEAAIRQLTPSPARPQAATRPSRAADATPTPAR